MVHAPKWPILSLVLQAALACRANRTSLPPLVPAAHLVQSHGQDDFIIGNTLHILVDQALADSTLDNGLTLIPPTLNAFANVFASDVKELFAYTEVIVSLIPASGLSSLTDYVFLTMSTGVNSTVASGSPTSEGYEMVVMPFGVNITGAGAKGAFWATRTLLQGLVQTQGHFPSSTITDQPDWPTRGIMLGMLLLLIHSNKYTDRLTDVGRHWYPIAFLKEMCAYISWFKMSEFVCNDMEPFRLLVDTIFSSICISLITLTLWDARTPTQGSASILRMAFSPASLLS